MNKNILIALGIVAIVGIGYFGFFDKSDKITNVVTVPQNETVQSEVVINDLVENVSTPPTTETESPKEEVIKTKGSYEEYNERKVINAKNGDVVLFFHASWCPSCRALNKDIEQNLSSIPDGVTILKTDYDTEKDLKKKYGVTYQHTLVQVDENGNMIKKWSGGSKLETLLAQIQ